MPRNIYIRTKGITRKRLLRQIVASFIGKRPGYSEAVVVVEDDPFLRKLVSFHDYEIHVGD